MIGYFVDVSDADDYFINERLITQAWDDLVLLGSAGTFKSKALWNAFNRLFYDPQFSLPTPALATPADLIILKKAQAEMTYYLAEHLQDEDSRKGLQAQGVIEAGIMKEKYEKDYLSKIPIPPFVLGLLWPWAVNKSVVRIVELNRSEEFDADEEPPRD